MKTEKQFMLYLLRNIVISIFILCILPYPAYSQSSYSILHNFGAENDGSQPFYGGPVVSGSTIYGMTQGGGFQYPEGSTAGTLYKINTDGSGYQILHNFYNDPVPPGPGDGTVPRGGLTLSGSTLYGCTEYGGQPYIHIQGTVFKINTDGTGYQVIHNFWEDIDPDTGKGPCNPIGAPVVSGSRLYGTTIDSINGQKGEIFAMNTDGSAFQVMHEFTGKPDDGATPNGALTLVGSTLYGMTFTGGHNGIDGGGSGYGTIYKIDTDGKNYQVLYHFAGYPTDGNNPYGALTLVGSKLFGMTGSGGPGGGGVIFSINPDGSGYRVISDIFNASGGTTSGPYGSLTLRGERLYGMTSAGGGGGASGVIFQVKTDGTGFKTLHSFKFSLGDGGLPMGDVTFAGSRLFGWTYANGAYDKGVFFSYRLPLANAGLLELLLLP